MTTYRPLNDDVTIKPSGIHGLGVFAVTDIPAGTDLGVARHKMNSEFDPEIRTPLGGFLNHSEYPNCRLVENRTLEGNSVMVLVPNKEILSGQELTIKYSLYRVD